MNFKTIAHYVVPQHFAPYIINDDATGLTDAEVETIETFLQNIYRDNGFNGMNKYNTLFTMVDADANESWFETNDVTGNIAGYAYVFALLVVDNTKHEPIRVGGHYQHHYVKKIWYHPVAEIYNPVSREMDFETSIEYHEPHGIELYKKVLTRKQLQSFAYNTK